MRRFSIRTRLTVWYVLLLTLIMIAFSLILYSALSAQLRRGIDDRVRAEAGVLANQVSGSEDGGAISLPPSEFAVRVLDQTGRVTFVSDALRDAPVDMAMLDIAARQSGVFQSYLVNDIAFRSFVLPLLHDDGVRGFIEVAESLSVVDTTLRDLALILLLAVPATLVFASLGGLFIADRALRPIDAITREAQRISEHQLDRRLNLDLPEDEVGRLGRTFDAMLSRLDAAFQRQRQFTSDASHELRTPLTVMKGNIGVTLNRPRSAKEYRETLHQVEDEVDRLARLTDDLLLLARADSGRPLVQVREIDVAAIVHDVVDDMRPLAEAKALSLNLNSPAALDVRGDPDQLHRVFYNLIENAIKYTHDGSIDVHVDLHPPNSTPESVRITIKDSGVGIALEHLSHVFERFYRVDKSRTSEQSGTGLGLAIAQSIVTSHSGTIQIESTVDVGTTISVTLPIEQA